MLRCQPPRDNHKLKIRDSQAKTRKLGGLSKIGRKRNPVGGSSKTTLLL